MINANHTDTIRISRDVPNGKSVTLTGAQWLQIYENYKRIPQTTSHRELEEIIKRFHRNCDPYDMTLEDFEVWVKWDKKFYPEKYDDI